MSDKIITADLMARLQRHYIKPGEIMPGGMFLPEVTLGSRRADALYVGFFQTRGKWLVGHEVKASRADWLHELDQPAKAEVWGSQCHSWYVVAPSTDIVRPEELPDGWGLMVPNARTTTRMDVVVKAAHYPEREPSWAATHAIVQRVDSLRMDAIQTARAKASQDALAGVDKLVEARLAVRGPDRERARADKAEALVASISEVLGLTVTAGDAWRTGTVSVETLRASFSRYLAADADVVRAIDYRLNGLAGARKALDDAIAAVDAVKVGSVQ